MRMRIRLGYSNAQADIARGAPNEAWVLHDCSLTADEMVKQVGWDSGTRADYIQGCEDGSYAKPMKYH